MCGDTGILVNVFRELSDQASWVLEDRHFDRSENNKQDVNKRILAKRPGLCVTDPFRPLSSILIYS